MTLVIRPENIDRLDRFLDAQEAVWPTVIEELTSGTKKSHWMWFVFPQLRSLGRSATAHYFGLSDLAEADRYIENTVLRERLSGCCDILMNLECSDALMVLGPPGNLKLQSSMTLFLNARLLKPCP